MTLTLKKVKDNARKWVHATPIRFSPASGEHRIQGHSHYSVRRPSDVAHKASRHNICNLNYIC